MWADLRVAARSLSKAPLFTTAVVLLLMFGVAANITVFSLVDALLLRPLPVRDAERLVRPITIRPPLPPRSEFVYEEYEAWKKVSGFEDVLAWSEHDVFVAAGDTTERARVHFVSDNFFPGLGAVPELGRLLMPDDQSSATGSVPVVLSYPYWKRRFDGERAGLGATLLVNGYKAVIVGVTREGFNGVDVETGPDLRAPLGWLRTVRPNLYGNRIFCEVAARLRRDVSKESARAEAEAVFRPTHSALYPTDPVTPGQFDLESVARGVSRMRSQFSGMLAALMTGLMLLLLLICANVAGLLIARAAGRTAEFAVRTALGASRFQLVRQLFCEALLLMVVSVAGAVALSLIASPLLNRALPPIRDLRATRLHLSLELAPDWRVLAFTICIAAGTVLLFGLLPAISATRGSVHPFLKEARTGGGWRGRQALVACQVAFTTMFLVGAGLMIATLQRLRTTDAGFDPDRVITFSVDPEMAKYTPRQAAELQRRLVEKAHTLPDTESTAIAGRGLMRGTGMKMTVVRAGESARKGDFMNTSTLAVSPSYFSTMRIAWRAGRNFTGREDPGIAPKAIIVNESFVRLFGGEGSVLGARFGTVPMNGEAAKPAFEVIGIVADAKYRSLREPLQPIVYGLASREDSFILHVRTRNAPESVIKPMRKALADIDPRLSYVEVTTLNREVSDSLWAERTAAFLATFFAALAALIVAAGLYALVAFAVAQRRREIGIRMALGAPPRTVAAAMLGRAAWLGGIGVAFGLLAAVTLSSKMAPLLYGVSPNGPVALLSAAVLAFLVTGVASLIPALRAARVNPASVLRSE